MWDVCFVPFLVIIPEWSKTEIKHKKNVYGDLIGGDGKMEIAHGCYQCFTNWNHTTVPRMLEVTPGTFIKSAHYSGQTLDSSIEMSLTRNMWQHYIVILSLGLHNFLRFKNQLFIFPLEGLPWNQPLISVELLTVDKNNWTTIFLCTEHVWNFYHYTVNNIV